MEPESAGERENIAIEKNLLGKQVKCIHDFNSNNFLLCFPCHVIQINIEFP